MLIVGMLVGIISTENNMEEPQKLKIELPYDLAIPFLGVYSAKMKTPS